MSPEHRDYNATHSQIAISQKGIYVNTYGGSILRNILGNINLKRKKQININRNAFSDSISISNIIKDYEINIIEKLFSEFGRKYNNRELAALSLSFLEDFMGISSIKRNGNGSEKLIGLLKKYFYIELFSNNKNSIITFGELFDTIKEFILILDSTKRKAVFTAFKMPIISLAGSMEYGTYEAMRECAIQLLGYVPNIISIGELDYLMLSKGNVENYSTLTKMLEDISDDNLFWDSAYFDPSLLLMNVWTDDPEFKIKKDRPWDGHVMINLNHPFIQYLHYYYTEISNNIKYQNSFRSFWGYLSDLIDDSSPINKSELNELNEILKPLAELEKPYVFTKNDFDHR